MREQQQQQQNIGQSTVLLDFCHLIFYIKCWSEEIFIHVLYLNYDMVYTFNKDMNLLVILCVPNNNKFYTFCFDKKKKQTLNAKNNNF